MSNTITNPKLPKTLQNSLADIIKHFPKNTTCLRDAQGQAVHATNDPFSKYIIKKYTLVELSTRIIAALKHSRAERSLRAGIAFDKLSIPTPQIHLAHIDSSTNPQTAFAVFDYFPGLEMPQFLKKHPEHTENIILQIANAVKIMAKNRISHGDLHAKNILIDQQAQISIIDLDGVRFHKFSFRHRRRYVRDRNRLISSTAKHTADQHIADQLAQHIPTSP